MEEFTISQQKKKTIILTEAGARFSKSSAATTSFNFQNCNVTINNNSDNKEVTVKQVTKKRHLIIQNSSQESD